MKQKEQFSSKKNMDGIHTEDVHFKQTFEVKGGKSIRKTEIGKYQYNSIDVLGQGYTGSVFKGTLITDPKQRFAIKVIDLKKFQKPDALALVEKQIEIHQKLKHPHIINCLDIYKSQGHYFIMTEYCPHGDLYELLKMQKIVHEDVALKIMKQVIDAYKYIMSKNIIHRDLKPANIMRFGSVWKIGDFGFATYCTEDFILDKTNLGTPLYMPPQSLYYSKYSAKTDIFSLGVIFYEMLTGKTPWPSRTQKQLVETMSGHKIEIPDIIEDPLIRQFLHKTCDNDYYSRMGKDEFKKFTFEEAENRVTRSKSSKSMKKMILLSPRDSVQLESNKPYQMKGQLQHVKSQKNGKFQKGAKKEQELDCIEGNIKKVKKQREFTEKVYFVIQNIKYMKLEKQENDRIVILLYKYLIRYLKMLANSRQNTLRLTNWDATKKSSGYKNLEEQFVKDGSHYHTYFIELSKTLSLEDIKHINRMFPELSIEAPLNPGFYGNFEQYLKEFMMRNLIEGKKEIKFVIPLELNVLRHLRKIFLTVRDRAHPGSKLKSKISDIEREEYENDEESNEDAYKALLNEMRFYFQEKE